MVRANLWELTLQCGETSSHWREGVELGKNSDELFASLVCEIFSFYDNLFRRFFFFFPSDLIQNFKDVTWLK